MTYGYVIPADLKRHMEGPDHLILLGKYNFHALQWHKNRHWIGHRPGEHQVNDVTDHERRENFDHDLKPEGQP